LKLLLERLKIKEVNEESVGFFIAPHLNAASRLGDVMIAVQLFLGNPAKNAERVEYLINLNRERRVQTDILIKSAEKQIEAKAFCQFFFAENWPQGIMGLVASHFAEKLNVPIIVSTIRQTDGMLSASCRAPEGYSIIDGLENSAKFLTSFGGHAGASGFIAKKENLEKIRGNLNKYFAQEQISSPEIKVETFVDHKALSLDLVEFLKFLAPFGEGNPAKIFGIKKVKITDIYLMGKDGNHAKFAGFISLSPDLAQNKNKPKSGLGNKMSKNKHEIQFVAFFAENFLEKIKIGDEIDILVSVSENEWRGKTSLQLKLIDARKS
jgi:single-stranded-DNA-specific exonuclease